MKLRNMLFNALITILLAACGQPGEIGLHGGLVGYASTAYDPNEPTHRENEIQAQIKTCMQLGDTAQLLNHVQTIRFEDTRLESGRKKVCEFSEIVGSDVNGNLSILDSYLRAQYVQTRTINLPANAVLCDIEIETQEQDFVYDDVFFLNLNSTVLASNHNSQLKSSLSGHVFKHSVTGQNISYYEYDWLKLRNTQFKNVVNDYCIGAEQGLSQCQWPVTEEFGQIKMKFDSEILIRASASTIEKGAQMMTFVITGDNDHAVDCYHQRMDLDLKLRYYLK